MCYSSRRRAVTGHEGPAGSLLTYGLWPRPGHRDTGLPETEREEEGEEGVWRVCNACVFKAPRTRGAGPLGVGQPTLRDGNDGCVDAIGCSGALLVTCGTARPPPPSPPLHHHCCLRHHHRHAILPLPPLPLLPSSLCVMRSSVTPRGCMTPSSGHVEGHYPPRPLPLPHSSTASGLTEPRPRLAAHTHTWGQHKRYLIH